MSAAAVRWKVANARWGESHPNRQAWVREQAALLLNSQCQQVLTQWQAILAEEHLSKNQVYNLNRAITYLSNHQHMVDYQTYLQQGFPITTGAVESACGHFVKIGPPMRPHGTKCHALVKTRSAIYAQHSRYQKKPRLGSLRRVLHRQRTETSL